MTAIVGYQDRDRVWIGGDSWAGSSGFGYLIAESTAKVFRNGPYLIGVSGSPRFAQVLRYAKLPEPPAKCDLLRFMCGKFIDAVRAAGKEAGVNEKENEVESCKGWFLVGYKDRLFYIQGDYQVIEPANGYCATGSAIEVATGALYALKNSHPWNPHNEIDGKVLVEMALEAAKHHVPTVDGPFVILSTR